jgi:hypothetical protein
MSSCLRGVIFHFGLLWEKALNFVRKESFPEVQIPFDRDAKPPSFAVTFSGINRGVFFPLALS